MYPFKHAIRTRYSETGQDGIIHNSSYTIYLEVARLEFLKHMGYDINQLEKNGTLLPVIDLSLKYLKPLYSLEDIIVEVGVESFTKVRFSLKYQILRGNVCVAKAIISHCFLNASFKPIAIPEKFLTDLKTFQ